MLDQYDKAILEQARQSRIDDLLTYFALQTFSKRKLYKHLETSLQKDIKAFFGDYQNAMATAKSVLFQISKAELVASACQQATEQGLGYLDDGDALHFVIHLAQCLFALRYTTGHRSQSRQCPSCVHQKVDKKLNGWLSAQLCHM